MNEITDDILIHYGMPRRSGRYPYGSGEDPYQHGRDFLGRVEELRKQNFTFTDEDGKTWTGDTAIAKSMGLTSGKFRQNISDAKYERRLLLVERAKSLQADGKGPSEIGKEMGLNESTIRSLLDTNSEARMNKARNLANDLKKIVEEKGMIDVGTGVELELNVSKEKLNQALYLLEKEGYPTYSGRMDQVTNAGQKTTQKVLCPPGTEHKEIYNLENVHTIKDYISRDGGMTLEKKFHYPASLDSKRLKVLLGNELGMDGLPAETKDGLIEIRRNVPDLSLGESRYSQVRILVDGTHYIKGMAVYSDDMPDGVDVVFNTNKSDVSKALKKIKDDPDNPFGSLIKDADQGGQYWYDPKTGKRVSGNDPSVPDKKLGLINKRSDEGDWDEWADALPSQFLGKQALPMIKKQLGLAKADKQAEFDEICALENPTVKKHYLKEFADNCDAAAVHLKAAALPGQKYHVIIPNNTLKDNEVYAPGYEEGTQLALIRYPHGGTFEIPILTVTHKNKLAEKIVGKDSVDGICITKKNADRLSGADFDGDTVMCIPTHDPRGKVKITSTNELKGLKGFDPQAKYAYESVKEDPDGTKHYFRNGKEFPVMKNTGTQMGIISNLITDMTLLNASEDKLARAVRHSMVVIDAEKHKLDYKASEIENNIAALKKEFQRSVDADGNVHYGGASTILSRSKGEVSVEKRQGTPKTNLKGKEWYDPSKPEGALIYKTSDDLYYPVRSYDKKTGMMTIRTTDGKKVTYDINDAEARDKYTPVERVDKATGKVTFTDKSGTINYKVDYKKQQSTRMAEADDAMSLVSEARNPKELAYADYANSMKALANQARKELATTGKIEYSRSAKAAYQEEVASLNEKLKTALLNTGRERAAQRMANVEIAAKKATDPDMKTADIKKASQQALSKYRQEVGSVSRKDRAIKITDREWEAIQAGAVSESTLTKILANSDPDTLRQRATPRTTTTLNTAQVNRIKALANSNYSLAEIAKKMGKSTSTISKYLKGVN